MNNSSFFLNNIRKCYENREDDHQSRASDISRKKKQNFVGFSGANSQKNRLISRDFRRKKSQNSPKTRPISGIFAEKKSKFAGKSADFAGF